jgi:hypothetical protein
LELLHASQQIPRNSGGSLSTSCACFVATGCRIKVMPLREKGMRNRRAAEVNADVEARIAQIEQMTVDQIAVFHADY